MITARDGTIHFDLSGDIIPPSESTPPPESRVTSTSPATGKREIITYAEMDRRQRENVLAAMEETGWRIYGPHGAAALLGIKPTTLASRIRKMGLKKPDLSR